MEAKGERTKPTPPAAVAASAAAISLVLGDHDLLGEILLRLAFPASLVRAAAVCRSWLRAASDPAFLRRFRDLHPPRLLGFYVSTYSTLRNWRVDFVPALSQPPELAAVLRRASFGLDSYVSRSTRVMDCRNGRVVASLFRGGDFTHAVHSPLHPARGLVTFPRLPTVNAKDDGCHIFQEVLSKEGAGGLSYLWFSLDYSNREEKATVCVYMLQDYTWRMLISATTQLSNLYGSTSKTLSVFLADDKIYMGISVHNALVLDLTSSTFFTIQYPDMVAHDGEIKLSRATGSGVYLVHVNELELCIWLHREGNDGMGDWLLLDTICLRDMCANLKMSNCTIEDGHTPDVYIHEVGDNAEFVFLEMYGCVLLLDVRSRTLQKVYEVTEKDKRVCWIHPFMMIWPPIFPALKE
uniref:Uncharacterized protein n=1 Tax=Arundo donax TaxID=35708 RepID=A0A0A8XPR0_ARUDO